MTGACVIFNPHAGSAGQADAVREQLSRRPGVTVTETRHADEARDLAAQAVRQGCTLVVAAGGDGTIHAVANGLLSLLGAGVRARLGVIPLGTGNDFRRTLGLPGDPAAALDALDAGVTRDLDVIRVDSGGRSLYTINVAAGGFSGQLQEVLTDELKSAWGPLAYLRGAADVVPDLTGYETILRFDDGSAERAEVFNVIVANGRTAAGGYQVASQANPEDGLADVVLVHAGGLLDLAGVAARLLAGDYQDSDLVTHRRARQVRVESRPGMWFSLDGELIENLPVTFTVVPRALPVVVGPDYQADVTVPRGRKATP